MINRSAASWMRRWVLSSVVVFAATAGCGDSESPRPDVDQGSGSQVSNDDMFSNLRVEDIEARRAVMRFVTAVETTCEAELGTAPDALDQTFLDPLMDPEDPYDINHQVPLVQLEPDTVYYVVARAEDRDGTVYRSEVVTFRTSTEASSTGPVNVALLREGATVLGVSSNFGGAANSATWGIDNALDGDLRTEWSSNMNGDDAWFEIDLGETKTIDRIGFQSRQMTNGTSIIESFQLTLDSGDVLGPFFSPDPDVYYDFNLPAPFTAKTVRFDAVETTGGNTGIKEFELYAPAP